MSDATPPPAQPPAINYVVGFLLVGVAWGFTTPFIRRAAKDHKPPEHSLLVRDDVQASWLKRRLYGAFFAVVDLLRNPRYAIPLLINLTGSVWFFLLIGQAGKDVHSTPSSARSRANILDHRIEPDRAYCKHSCVPIYCAR